MIKEILFVHHSHTDIGYTHPQPVVLELHNRFIDEALDIAEATQDYDDESRFRWTCEVTGITEAWWKAADNRNRDRFVAAIKRKQFEVRQGCGLGEVKDGKARLGLSTSPIAGGSAPVEEKIATISREVQGHVMFDVAAGRVTEIHLSVDRTVNHHKVRGSSYRFQRDYIEEFVEK